MNSAGPCRICENSCPAKKIENPNEYNKKECKDQKRARPCMKAGGIDVVHTARKAGYIIEVVKEKGEYSKKFGLLLLE